MHLVNARGILSPKMGMNIYRGCGHGCVYCDARSSCYGMKHAFEDVEVKINAPQLLEEALSRKRKRGMIFTGSMSDPYQPLEMELGLTRKCMEIALARGFGWTCLTKSPRMLRDLDLMRRLSDKTRCVAQMTLTTADDGLCRILEPGVAPTSDRFQALLRLKAEKIPTVVWMSPLLPFINDTPENVSSLLDMCQQAGVRGVVVFDMGLTLRDGDREYYYQQLDRHFPGLKAEYVRRYGNQYILSSPRARELWELFDRTCDQAGILRDAEQIFSWLRTWPPEHPAPQTSLFDA